MGGRVRSEADGPAITGPSVPLAQTRPPKFSVLKPLLGSLLVLVLIGTQTPPVNADDAPTSSAETSAVETSGIEAEVKVRPIDGAAVRGRLTSLDEQSLSLRDESGAEQSWDRSELRAISVTPSPQAVAETPPAETSPVETPPVVLLANDDVLCGTVISADEDTLTVAWRGVDPPQQVTLPLEVVRSFALQQPDDELHQIRLRRIWALLEPQADRLVSTGNTHFDGEFLGLSDGQLQLKTSLGIVRASEMDVVAVVMNSELVTRPETDGPYLVVSFRDGSRVSLDSHRLADDGRLTGRTVWGVEISFPLDRVTGVLFLGDRVISLAGLTPAAYVFTPYLTQKHPLVANRNVKGGRLRLRGRMYATGLGVSSKAEVTYDLSDGGYQRFETVVGVDDLTDGGGDVLFAVEVDGRRVYESKPLDGRSPAATIGPLDVTGARTLKLIVEFGRFANIQDVADWCDPVLIKPRG